MDSEVGHRIDRLIWVAVNIWGDEGRVSIIAALFLAIGEDAQSLTKLTHHLVFVLAKVPCQLPPNLVMAFKPTLGGLSKTT